MSPVEVFVTRIKMKSSYQCFFQELINKSGRILSNYYQTINIFCWILRRCGNTCPLNPQKGMIKLSRTISPSRFQILQTFLQAISDYLLLLKGQSLITHRSICNWVQNGIKQSTSFQELVSATKLSQICCLLATASEMQYIMWVSRVTCSTDTGLSQHVVLLWIIT